MMSETATNLRRIQPLHRAGLKPNVPSARPEVSILKIHQLRINDEYQRKLGAASITLIRRIVNQFQWTKFRPPVVTLTGETDPDTNLPTYEVLDGQHSCIAALTNGNLRELPCWVVTTRNLVEKAEAFVGLNRERVLITGLSVFWADVAAQNEDALAVLAACEKTGARVVRRPPPYGDFGVGETISVATLRRLAKKGGPAYVRRVLDAAMLCNLAPVSQDFIIAFELLLLSDNGYKLSGDYDQATRKIAAVVNRIGIDRLKVEATSQHAGSKSGVGRCLAGIIFAEVQKDDRSSD